VTSLKHRDRSASQLGTIYWIYWGTSGNSTLSVRRPRRLSVERTRQLGRQPSVSDLQALVSDGAAADRFIEESRQQAALIDPNDILYSLASSADYDPQPGLASIKTNVLALNFSDDEFNPSQLHILDRLMPKVPHGRFIVQEASETSYGHLTMAHPELWSQHVAEFMYELGDAPP
jgi:homoserine O-acetyltransferase